ncbi:MAG: hypothetical protein MJA31_13410 [Clostridia bacterium]|nr:hypothetical protein [Clostridia bacterium]
MTKEADRMDLLQKFKQYNRQDRKAELEKIYQFCNSIENMDIYLNYSSYEDYDNDYWGGARLYILDKFLNQTVKWAPLRVVLN